MKNFLQHPSSFSSSGAAKAQSISVNSLNLRTERGMKVLLLLSVLFLLFLPKAKSQCFQAPNYCTGITAANNANYGMGIQIVNLGTSATPAQINNVTTAGNGTQIYFNYTNMVVRAGAGDTVYFQIRGGSSNQTLFRIYIDYNNDGTFNTTTPELVYTSANITVANTTISGNFVVPSTVATGTAYRLRVASDGQGLIPAPCGPLTYSAEFEDYTLLVPSTTADLMSGNITSPTGPIVGNNTVAFNFTNVSTATITSLDIYYQLDANTPVSQSLSSLSIAPGAVYTATFTTPVSIPSTGTFNLRTWTDNPNGVGNNTPVNDTICRPLVTYCSGPLSGAYTINPAGSGTSNFKSFGGADSALTSCGVSGPVSFNVSNGVYPEFLFLTAIPGASSVNNIVFNGNGSTLQYNCNASFYPVVRLQGVKHVTLDSLTIRSTNATYGWGVHFFNNCDSNVLKNCLIDLTAVTSSSSTNSAGIVFSNSTTSQTTTGNTCVGNLILNNTIRGSASAASLYFGIVGAPATSSATYTGNRFINNKIENFYLYGIYWSNSNRTTFRGNTISRPTKTNVTTTYGIYFSNSSRADTIDANVITNLYGGSPTNANTTYLVYAINYSGTNAEPNVFSNNLFYNIKGEGPLYGLYFLTAFNNRIYNNTMLFDNTSSTSANVTQAMYFTGSTSTFSALDIRNNIVSFTRTGSGAKTAVVFTSAITSGLTMNKNGFHSSSPNYIACNHAGVNYATLGAWKLGMPAYNAQSVDFAPNFVNPATANFSPRDGAYDGNGDSLTFVVPTDITGAVRSMPMDIGAYEASPIAIDAAMSDIITPIAPYAAGNKMIAARIRNSGTTTITSATINWMVNGVAQTPISWSGTLAGGAISAPFNLDSVNILSNTLYTISVTVTNPNGSADPNPANDQISTQTAAQVSGTVTINSAGSGPGVFTSFTSFANLLKFGGLGGAVVANVTVGSGPYTEQVFFDPINGSSAANTITINGNNEQLQFDNVSPGSLGVMNLTGVDFLTIDNLRIKTLNLNYGIGVIITSAANNNRIANCFIDIGSVQGSSLSAGIALTASLSSPTSSGINGSNNIIENNTITGNSTGGPYYGMSIIPSSNFAGANTNNIIRNNNVRDFTVYGFYISYTAGTLISGNTVWRPTKSSPTTFYGFYGVNSMAQDTLENNIIKQPFKMLETTTNTFYGIYFIATNIPTARPVIIRNNQMYDIKSNGNINGFYQLSANNLKFLNNTFVVDHPTSTSTSATYLYYNSGTPTFSIIRNNIFYLNRGGSGTKYIYYLATTGAGYTINNNVAHLRFTGTNNFYGYYAANIATFAAWRAVNASAYDQNSVSADPQFRLSVGPEYYQPGTDSVNNIGFATTDVIRDVTGALRSITTPDPGAYEFSVPGADAGLTKVLAPLSPLTLGSQNVDVQIKSFGTTALTSANIEWQINGTTQTSASWFGSLGFGDSSTATLGTYNFATPGFYRIKAWSTLPNGVSDSFPINDTINVTVCTPLAGTYTVNPSLPASDTNFVNVRTFLSTVRLCGVSGPITCQVAPGTYNGELTINAGIPGISATNNVTIVGADSATTKIVHDGSGQRATILLNGAKHFTFRNLTIESTAPMTSGGYGVLLMNAADSNKVIRSTVKVALLTVGYSTHAPIISSSNALNPNNAGNNANYLLVDSCRLVGGYYGVNLFNNSAPKALGNVIRNCDIINPFYYGIFAYYQNQIVIQKNRIINTGYNINTFAASVYAFQCDNGINITKNQIYGQTGGYGMYFSQNYGTAINRNIVGNNMIQLGIGTNQSYGIYDAGNAYMDIAHNSIHNTSGDASYVSCGIYFNYSSPTLYNNARIVNNVITAPNGAMAVWCTNTASLSTSNMFINHNVYYSPSTYPFRIVNTIYQTLQTYRTAMGVFVTNIDTNSIWVQPTFFSATNLRSITPQLDSMGFVLPTVPDDIDGNIRSIAAPDAGVNEFSRPGEDAGVLAILEPSLPVSVGQKNVKVVIRNYGLNTITSVNVTYRVDTLVRTRAYTGTLLPGAVDTVLFDSTSGLLGANQRYNYTGGAVTMKAYTTSPNAVADLQNLNDTSYLSFCSALNGVYTINPAGSGTNNFLNFGDAINRLNCGGVTGNVTFNVATGTYTGQIDITTIVGASDSAKVVFKAATNNAADVILTSASSTALDNYTVRLRGANYVNLERLTIRNTNATNGRVVSINKFTSNNTNANNITIRNCVLEGINTTSTSDALTVVFGPTGDNASNINITNNQIRFGSYGVYIGGQNVINLFTPGLVIDSNVIFQPYWAGVYLLNRREPKIRSNYFDGNPSYGYYNVFLSSVAGDVEVSNNNMQNLNGYYALYMQQCNYYGEPGVAKVLNNVINMTSVNTQYGIYFVNSSSTYFINNTVRCASTSTGTYAYFIVGNSTNPSVPQVVATNNVRNINNIYYSANGYATYYSNFQAVSGTAESNNNLYYSGATNFSFVNGTNYLSSTFNTTYRNIIHAGSDKRSVFANIPFTSNTDLKPLTSAPLAWAASGRAQQNFFVNRDITGATRSQAVNTGAPDIGAHEFLPTSAPPALGVTGSIGTGNTQHFISFGDTVAKIVWGLSGTVPTSIGGTYHTGALISDPTNGSRNPGAQYMDAFWRINASGGSGYSYDLQLNFDPNMLGTVPFMSDLKLAKKQTGVSGTWTHFGSTLTTVDSVNQNFSVLGLMDFSDFTGTTDISPLPVKLAAFNAVRSEDDALLFWTTASELNSRKFVVERAENGKDFTAIGEVAAAGNSSKNISYAFEDLGARMRINGEVAYYRLKMVDRDGTFEYSPVRRVSFEQNAATDMNVYPNPFEDGLTLSFGSIDGSSVQVEIIDLFGKVCYKGTQILDENNPSFVMNNLNNLPAGIYIVKANKGAEVLTRKLIKN